MFLLYRGPVNRRAPFEFVRAARDLLVAGMYNKPQLVTAVSLFRRHGSAAAAVAVACFTDAQRHGNTADVRLWGGVIRALRDMVASPIEGDLIH